MAATMVAPGVGARSAHCRSGAAQAAPGASRPASDSAHARAVWANRFLLVGVFGSKRVGIDVVRGAHAFEHEDAHGLQSHRPHLAGKAFADEDVVG